MSSQMIKAELIDTLFCLLQQVVSIALSFASSFCHGVGIGQRYYSCLRLSPPTIYTRLFFSTTLSTFPSWPQSFMHRDGIIYLAAHVASDFISIAPCW